MSRRLKVVRPWRPKIRIAVNVIISRKYRTLHVDYWLLFFILRNDVLLLRRSASSRWNDWSFSRQTKLRCLRLFSLSNVFFVVYQRCLTQVFKDVSTVSNSNVYKIYKIITVNVYTFGKRPVYSTNSRLKRTISVKNSFIKYRGSLL